MSGQQLKYVRTDAGFATCPASGGQHVYLARAVKFTPISAGFIDFDFDGLPFCHGRSESLNLNSMACDTAALRKEWGMVAPAAPAVGEFGPPVRAVAIVVEQLDDNEARIRWMFNPVPDGEELLWDHKDAPAAPLNPAALAEAQKFGEGLSDESLEHEEPAL